MYRVIKFYFFEAVIKYCTFLWALLDGDGFKIPSYWLVINFRDLTGSLWTAETNLGFLPAVDDCSQVLWINLRRCGLWISCHIFEFFRLLWLLLVAGVCETKFVLLNTEIYFIIKDITLIRILFLLLINPLKSQSSDSYQ